MIIFKKVVFVTGLLISSAMLPASAQQANMLLEIQSMRTEIQELRDMVERQQYELRQLKQAANQAGTTAPAVAVPTPTWNESQTANTYTVPSYENDATQGLPETSLPRTSLPTTGIPTQNRPNQSGATQAAPAAAAQYPVGTVNNQQYPGNSDIRNAAPSGAVNEPYVDRGYQTQAGVQSDGVVIEDRVITGSPVTPPAQELYAPVEERVIGGAANVANTVEQQTDRVEQAVSEVPVAVKPDNAIPANVLPVPESTPAVLGSGAVIAVPSQPVINNSAVVNKGVVNNTAVTPSAVHEVEYYQQGFELLKQSKHEQAMEVFKQQLTNYPTGEYADDANYWIAESMYINRDLDTSKRYFKTIIDNFKQSPRLPDAMLKTAYIEQEQGNKIEARMLLQEISQYHPRSNAAISAKNRLAELK